MPRYSPARTHWYLNRRRLRGAFALTMPFGEGTGATTADLSVMSSIADGTLYWVVTRNPLAPSIEEIVAGQDETGAAAPASGNQAVTSPGEQAASATLLTTGTNYWAHFVLFEGATVLGTPVTSPMFTTA